MTKICDACDRILSGDPDPEGYDRALYTGRMKIRESEPRYRHHDSAQELLYCIQQTKCSICMLLWEYLDEEDQRRIAKPSWVWELANRLHESLTGDWEFKANDGYYCRIGSDLSQDRTLEFVLGQKARRVIRFHLTPSKTIHRWNTDFPTENSSLQTPGNRYTGRENRILSDSPTLENCWGLISEWCIDCVKTHGNDCSKTAIGQSTFFPTRVIDVGILQENDLYPNPCLCVDVSERPSPPYMTLSHCWGKDGLAFRLLPTNYDSMKRRISYESLPKTFRDAVDVTRKLNIRYLWIDALCILQGDTLEARDDWMQQSRAMDQVYLHSWCNIAASGASDSSQGLFFQRDPELVEEIRLHLGWPWWNEDRHCTLLEHEYEKACLGPSPLLNRAWVVQELVLPSRVLHFGSRQVAWKCLHRFACETFPKDVCLTTDVSHGGRYLLPQAHTQDEYWWRHMSEAENQSEVIECWQELLENYMECDLTRETDKLVAIGGLIENFVPRFNDNCVAGLWMRTLPRTLTWRTKDGLQANGDLACRQRKYRAPTWSWASVDGKLEQPRVLPDYRIGEPLAEVLDVHLTGPDGIDRPVQAPLTGGFIKLLGILIDARKCMHLTPPIIDKHKAIRIARIGRQSLDCYFDEDLDKSFFPHLEGFEIWTLIPRSVRNWLDLSQENLARFDEGIRRFEERAGAFRERIPLLWKVMRISRERIDRFSTGPCHFLLNVLKACHQVAASHTFTIISRFMLYFVLVAVVFSIVASVFPEGSSLRRYMLNSCYATWGVVGADIVFTITLNHSRFPRAKLYFLPTYRDGYGSLSGLILMRATHGDGFYRQGMFECGSLGNKFIETMLQKQDKVVVIVH